MLKKSASKYRNRKRKHAQNIIEINSKININGINKSMAKEISIISHQQ